jgi:hypothetical protein
MTTPESPSPQPQPRDIALEQETPELAAELEAQSDQARGDQARGDQARGDQEPDAGEQPSE